MVVWKHSDVSVQILEEKMCRALRLGDKESSTQPQFFSDWRRIFIKGVACMLSSLSILVEVRLEGTAQPCSWSHVEKKKTKEKDLDHTKIALSGGWNSLSETSKLTPFPSPVGIWGSWKLSKEFCFLGFIQLEFPETPVRAIKPR